MREDRDEQPLTRYAVDRALGERAAADPELATWAYAEGLSLVRPGEPGLPRPRVDPATIRRLPVRATVLLGGCWVLLLPVVANTGVPAGPGTPGLPTASAVALGVAAALGFSALAGLIGRWPVTPALTLVAVALLLAVSAVDLAVGRAPSGPAVAVRVLALLALGGVALWCHRRRWEPGSRPG